MRTPHTTLRQTRGKRSQQTLIETEKLMNGASGKSEVGYVVCCRLAPNAISQQQHWLNPEGSPSLACDVRCRLRSSNHIQHHTAVRLSGCLIKMFASVTGIA